MPSRSQIENTIIKLITDALNRQNTAANVREALRLLNSALFNAQDDELTIQHIKGLGDALANSGGTPPLPTGVSWVVTPNVQLNGNTAQISPGSVRVDGVVKNIAQRAITEPARPEGYQTPFTVVVNPFATPPVAELLEGDTVAENESYAFPPTPADRLWLGNFMLTSNGFAQAPGINVRSISVNGITEYPDGLGDVNLVFEAQNNDYTPLTLNLNGITTLDCGGQNIVGRTLVLTGPSAYGTPNNHVINFSNLVNGTTLTLLVKNEHSGVLNLEIENTAGYKVFGNDGNKTLPIAAGGYMLVGASYVQFLDGAGNVMESVLAITKILY